MVRSISGSICALALLTLASSAGAQEVLTGTVQRIDGDTAVIVLDDGRTIQTTGRTIVLVQPLAGGLAAVEPGARVTVIESAPSLFPGGVVESPAARAAHEAQAP
jgi:hypothetical protein